MSSFQPRLARSAGKRSCGKGESLGLGRAGGPRAVVAGDGPGGGDRAGSLLRWALARGRRLARSPRAVGPRRRGPAAARFPDRRGRETVVLPEEQGREAGRPGRFARLVCPL